MPPFFFAIGLTCFAGCATILAMTKTPFIESGLPVAITQGAHRGRWGYVAASDGVNVRIAFAHLAMDEDVTVPVEHAALITFLAS